MITHIVYGDNFFLLLILKLYYYEKKHFNHFIISFFAFIW